MLNAYNNSLCNLSSIKQQLLMILKKGLLTELEKNYKKKYQKGISFLGGRVHFGWVGRSTANQDFLRSALQA